MADSFIPSPYTDLAVWLDYPDETMATDRAKLALESATARIQDAINQRVVAVDDDVQTLVARPNQWVIWLRQRPVTAVTTVEVDGVAQVVDVDYYVDGSALVAKNTSWFGSGTWPATVEITYDHGYAAASIPQALKDECLRLAALIFQNPESLRSETIGAVSWTTAGDGAALQAVSPHIIEAYGSFAVA